MKLKDFSIYLLITVITFLILELISWKVLNEYYKRNSANGEITLKNIKNFNLFSLKENFISDLELSTYYSFRYKGNYTSRGENYKFQTIYKGLLDEKYDNKINRPLITENDTYDIYFFGGSTAFTKSRGSLGKHINVYLDESKCSKKFNFRVITGGHSGYATINQINRLVSDVIYLNPEYVVFFDGINDFLHSHSVINWEINDTIHQNNYRKVYSKINDNEFNFFHFFQTLPGRIYSIVLAEKVIGRLTGINIIPNTYDLELISQLDQRVKIAEKNKFNLEGVNNYLQNHKVLHALANEFNFKALHIFQPTLSFDIHRKINGYEKIDYASYFPDTNNVLNLDKKKKVSDYYFDKSIRFYEIVEKRFKNLNEDINNKYISYASIFSNQKDLSKIYYDNVHYEDYFAINVISKKISYDILNTLNCD